MGVWRRTNDSIRAGEKGSSLVSEGPGKTRLLDMGVDFEIV
jgi:hypothetical protein